MITASFFTKTNGPLTKTISLDESGAIVSDSKHCCMAEGEARRIQLKDIAAHRSA